MFPFLVVPRVLCFNFIFSLIFIHLCFFFLFFASFHEARTTQKRGDNIVIGIDLCPLLIISQPRAPLEKLVFRYNSSISAVEVRLFFFSALCSLRKGLSFDTSHIFAQLNLELVISQPCAPSAKAYILIQLIYFPGRISELIISQPCAL